MPPWLSSPADLSMLESNDARPLLMSVRDGQSFFDQLQLNAPLRQHFAKPSVLVSDLCDCSLKTSGRHDQRALTMAEVLSFLEHTVDEHLELGTRLFPLSACWPMGYSWASHVAQSIMTGAVLEAGCSREQFLCRDNVFPPLGLSAVSVATDDVIEFERCAGTSTPPGSTSPVFGRLDAVWKGNDIKSSPKLPRLSTAHVTGQLLGLI